MPPANTLLRARLIALLGVAWLVVVTVVPPSATRLDVWPWAGLASAGWLVMASGALMLFALGRLALPSPAIALGAGAFAGVAVLSAWNGPWSGGSLAASLPAVGGVGALWLLSAAFTDRVFAPAVRGAFEIAAVAVIGVALAGWAGQALAAPSLGALLQGRNPVPFGHSVYTAGAALLAGSWLAAGALRNEGGGRLWRLLGTAGSVLVVVSSASRAGVAAAAAIGALVAFGWWWRRGRKRRDALLGAALLTGLVAFGVATNVRLRDFVLHGQWSALASASNDHRLAMADAGRTLGASHGLLGPGPGTVPLAYHAGDARVTHAPDGSLQVHSAPLQVWATTGPAGLLTLVLLLAACAPAVARALRPASPADTQVLAAGAIGYGLFALTDHQFDLPFITLFAAAHVAALVAGSPAPERSVWSPMLRAIALIAGLLLLAGPAWYRVRDLSARSAFASAALAHDAGDADAVRDSLETAARRAPWDRYYAEAAAAWSWDRDPAFARLKLEQALAASLPWPSEFATYNLAWLVLSRDEPGLAVPRFAEAAQLAPHRTGVFLGQGFALAAAGDNAAAVEAFARQLFADPRTIALSPWEQPGLRDLRPAVAARIQEIATTLAARTDDPALRDRIHAVAALLRWWWEDDAPVRAGAAADLPAAARRLADALENAPAAGAGPWEGFEGWGILGATWALGRPDEAVPEDWRPPLAARLVTAPDFRRFVLAAAVDPAFRRAYRVGRGGYRIVMRHPASPDVFDYPVFEENLLLAPHLGELFPARGWLPGALWRRVLDEDVASR